MAEARCANCGKSLGAKAISKGGKKFCCGSCVTHWDKTHGAEKKKEFCEFC